MLLFYHTLTANMSTAGASAPRQPQVTTSTTNITNITSTAAPKGSTRRIATIRVTRPVEDEPLSPQRRGSGRIKSSLREATTCQLVAAPSTARVITVDEKDMVTGQGVERGSGSGWKALRAARDRLPSHSSELNGKCHRD